MVTCRHEAWKHSMITVKARARQSKLIPHTNYCFDREGAACSGLQNNAKVCSWCAVNLLAIYVLMCHNHSDQSYGVIGHAYASGPLIDVSYWELSNERDGFLQYGSPCPHPAFAHQQSAYSIPLMFEYALPPYDCTPHKFSLVTR